MNRFNIIDDEFYEDVEGFGITRIYRIQRSKNIDVGILLES